MFDNVNMASKQVFGNAVIQAEYLRRVQMHSTLAMIFSFNCVRETIRNFLDKEPRTNKRKTKQSAKRSNE